MRILERPKVALFPAHPAQLWIMRTIAEDIKGQVDILWVLRDKDVLIQLADKFGLEYIVISRAKTGLLGNAIELLCNLFKAVHITYKYRIDLWLTKYGAANIAARLCFIKSLSFNDDDIDVVPLIAMTSYPFAHRVIAPNWVRLGKHSKKAIRYKSNHELMYLHPSRFQPDPSALEGIDSTSFLFIRLSGLNAHHDVGIQGISFEFIDDVIATYSPNHQIVISSEKELPPEYEQYRFRAPVERIHHVLSFARCVITDSLSMAMEACVLGTPSVRLSDFGSKINISGFDAIEPYKLIFNFPPAGYKDAETKLDEIMSTDQKVFEDRRKKLIQDMIDPLTIFRKAILNALN